MPNYLDPKTLSEAIIDWQQDPTNEEKRNKVGQFIIIIANNVWKRFDNKQTTKLTDEAVSNSILNSWKNIKNFDVNKGGAFTYITTTCFQAIFRTLRNENKRNSELTAPARGAASSYPTNCLLVGLMSGQ